MNNGTILFLTFAITIIIGVAIRYFLWKLKIKDQKSIDKDWEDFERAISKNDVIQIRLIGEKLVWNSYLKTTQLKTMIKIVNQNLNKNPELEKLSLDLLNKKLHRERKILTYNH